MTIDVTEITKVVIRKLSFLFKCSRDQGQLTTEITAPKLSPSRGNKVLAMI